MVWLNMVAENGSGLYLEIVAVEQRRGPVGSVLSVSGLVGDGQYEGQVLVEIGARTEVTFVDQWLEPARLKEFFNRVERDEVARSLGDAVAAMSLEEKIRMIVQPSRPRAAHRHHTPTPHPYRREKIEPTAVQETEKEWKQTKVPANDQ